MLRFAYTILYVENVPESIEFYERAFGFKRKFITEEQDYGELLTGDTVLSFASLELGRSNIGQSMQASTNQKDPFAIELSFTSSSIEDDFDHAIKAGAILVNAINAKPWGQRVGYVRDNNGFLIEICTPMQW